MRTIPKATPRTGGNSKSRTRDYAKILRKQVAADAKLRAIVEQDAWNTSVAVQIYNARTQAKLTQQQLADKIGTKQSVIARLEDADYNGHSLSMLRKIAAALGCTMEVNLKRDDTPVRRRRTRSATPTSG